MSPRPVSSSLSSRLPLLAASFLALASCSQHVMVSKAPKANAARPAASEINGATAQKPPAMVPRKGAHAVLSTERRAFVLTDDDIGPSVSRSRELLPGGFALEIETAAPRPTRTFTLVGPEGHCSAHATRAVRVSLDLGGYSGASMPGARHSGFEIEGCASLVATHSFLLALDGDDPRAAWVHPAHVGESEVPADRRSGESQVFLHRFALPMSELEIVERSVLRNVTASCSEERRDVLVVDELDHPVAQHTGFMLRGALSTSAGPLLVLVGHDEPEALRVVELGVIDTRITLDTHMDLFQDVERASC